MALARTNYTHDGSGGWTAASYVPTLFAKKTLVDFYASTIFKEICNIDYEGEFKNVGDTINIRQAPAITVNSYTVGGAPGTGITYQIPSKDDLSMLIDQAIYTAFQVDDVDKVQSDIDLMNMYATDASERMKINVDTNVLLHMSTGAHASNKGATAGVQSGNLDFGTDAVHTGATGPLQIVGNSTESASANRYAAVDTIVRMGQALDEQNVPAMDRYVVIPAWYATKLKTSELKQANITGDATGTIRTGLIGSLNGMKIYVNNNLPAGTIATHSDWVIAGTKAACSFALQMSKSDRLPIEASFGEYMRTLWVFGRQVVKPEALVTVICNGTAEV